MFSLMIINEFRLNSKKNNNLKQQWVVE